MSELQSFGFGFGYVALGIVALLIAKVIKDVATPFGINEELTVKDNPAIGVVLAGYFIGVTIIFLGAVIGPDFQETPTMMEVATMMATDFTYAMGGVIALLIGRIVLDKVVLTSFSVTKEIIEDRNCGTAAVECGNMIATALVVAGAIHGEGGGPATAVAFFALGQLALVVFGWLYKTIVKYDVHAEIEKDNVAAGVALGCNLVAFAIIVLRGISGDMISWESNLLWFGIYVVSGATILMFLRKVADALFLPNTTIAHEIANDQNMNAAWIEGAIATSVASIIFFVL